MNKNLENDILYIQQRCDLLCAVLGSLARKDAVINNSIINELIGIGVDISMTCQMMLDN